MKRSIQYISGFVGLAFVLILPYIHIGIIHLKIWVPDKTPVNTRNCTCSCWDTVFKGTYQGQKYIHYKHMYFNATKQSYIIWILTVCHIVAAYEAIKYLWSTYIAKELRITMAFLFLLDIYPNYYTWWIYVNYFNDDFYEQCFHQLFFSVTEIISTCVILNLCSKKNDFDKWKMMTVVCISSVHLVIGGVDQFFVQLFLGEGARFKKIRGFGLVIPDLCHVLLPIYEYRRSNYGIGSKKYQETLFTKWDAFYCVCTIMIGSVIGRLIT